MRTVTATLSGLDHFMTRAAQVGAFTFDVETSGPHRLVPKVNQVTWLSMATQGASVVVPLGHPNGDTLISKARRRKNKETGEWTTEPALFSMAPTQLSAEAVFNYLRPIYFSSDITKIAHNAKFDLLSCAKYFGEYPCPPYGDTLVAAWLLDENRPLGLKALVNTRYGSDYDVEGVGKCVEAWPFSTIARYAWLDAKFTWLLWQHYRPLLAADAGLEYIWNLEMDVLACLLHMESHGVHVDEPAMRELRDELAVRLIDIEGRVYKAAGTVFNLGSVPQKQEILYGPDGAGLKPTKLTKGGVQKKRAGKELTIKDYSTDDEALKPHKKHPVVSSILDYQEVSKIKGTYLDGYLGTDEKDGIIFDGRVYPSFSQYGTVTGRQSCRSPNLQNIPARGEVGKNIRYFFCAAPGDVLLDADYGQIEKRILAHYCRDGKLYEGFMNGIDAHTTTACALFKVAPEDVTPFMRNDVAKACGFAVDYGAEEDRVASMAGISVKEARAFLKLHEREFPEIYDFKERLLKAALSRETPHVRTLLGRCRRLPDLRSRNYARRKAAERQLLNAVCQGGNADITKLAMTRLHKNRPEWLQILLTVHDEIICSVPSERAEEGAEILKWAMTGEGIQELLRVPIITDVKVCGRWSEAKD